MDYIYIDNSNMTNLYLNREWLINWKFEPSKLLARHSDGWLVQYIETQPNMTECRLIQFPEEDEKTRDEIMNQSRELLHIHRFAKEFFDTCVQQ